MILKDKSFKFHKKKEHFQFQAISSHLQIKIHIEPLFRITTMSIKYIPETQIISVNHRSVVIKSWGIIYHYLDLKVGYYMFFLGNT